MLRQRRSAIRFYMIGRSRSFGCHLTVCKVWRPGWRRRNPVHLFNIGHRGSTLLHHVLNRSGAATCVSEPLFLFDLAMERVTMAPERLVELIAAGCRLLQHSVAGRRLVSKHFSQSTTLLPAFAAATPGASW